jgi:FkbM family methyltransferase
LQIINQIIYAPPVNYLIRNTLKLIPGLPKALKIHPSGQLRVTLKNGKGMHLATNQTCHVSAVIFWEGSSSYEFSDIFQDLFSKISSFFDLGSNIGYYSIMAGVTNPSVIVHAFDPSPGPFSYLSENLQINGLKNIHPHQLAVSDEDGTFSFHIAYNKKYPWLKYNSLGGSGHLSHVRENPTRHQVQVQAYKLDTFVTQHNIQSMDLMKLDVEEAEHLVLAGAKDSIRRFRPIIVSEVFSNPMLHQIREQIIGLGYRAYLFEDMKLKFQQLSEESTVNQIENYFFVPEEKVGLVEKWIA